MVAPAPTANGATKSSPLPAGYELDRFAGRYALGKNLPAVDTKTGFSFNRVGSGEVRVLGGACSEVLGGANLAALLRDGWELEQRAMSSLARSEPAEVLSIHTSAGVPPQLDHFLSALEPHLPGWARAENDWCVNLQAEGASAVHAAIDMALQAYHGAEDFNRADARTWVACGASSYHGPASTSPGGATPLGARAKGLTHPVRYPVPSPFLRHRGEDDASFHGRLLTEFRSYLDTYEHEIGVLLVEPQWGSSVAAMPWPPALLQAYIAEAKSRGIAVVSDEIMCGLGRHGAQPTPGGTGCFLTECWELTPDVVTFGKSIGGGAGHLLSGAILLSGAERLSAASRTAFQSHTYAGSSARALANGAALLDALPSWRPAVQAIGDAIAPIAAELNEASGGAVMAHGQGALWGGLFAHSDKNARTAANLAFKKRCADARVLPYFVPVGGFMLTPRYDDDPELLAGAVKEMAQCALETTREMGWAPAALLPLARPSTPSTPPAQRYQGPEEATSSSTACLLDGPVGPWLASAPLADAAGELGRVVQHETSLEPREVAMAALATAYAHRAPAQWTSAVQAAKSAGLEKMHIAALARGAVPAFESTSRELAVYAVAADLLEHKRVSSEHYAMAVTALGEKGMVELVSAVGYYTYVALTVNAFELALPAADMRAPWKADA